MSWIPTDAQMENWLGLPPGWFESPTGAVATVLTGHVSDAGYSQIQADEEAALIRAGMSSSDAAEQAQADQDAIKAEQGGSAEDVVKQAAKDAAPWAIGGSLALVVAVVVGVFIAWKLHLI